MFKKPQLLKTDNAVSLRQMKVKMHNFLLCEVNTNLNNTVPVLRPSCSIEI